MDRTLLRSGFLLFLIALLTGILIPFLKSPRLGLSAHMIAIIAALFLIAVGIVWGRIRLRDHAKRLLFWLWLVVGYANWFGTLLAAIVGGSSLMPIASDGSTSSSVGDVIIMIVILPMTLMAIIAVAMTVWGLRGKDDIAN